MSIDMSVIIRAHNNIQCPPATVIKISLTSLYFIAHNIFSHEGIALRTNSLQFPGQFKMLLCMLLYMLCAYICYMLLVATICCYVVTIRVIMLLANQLQNAFGYLQLFMLLAKCFSIQCIHKEVSFSIVKHQLRTLL